MCLCLKCGQGRLTRHLRKDYKGQPDHVRCPFFPLWFFCIAALIHLLLIKTQPQQAPPGLFRQPGKKKKKSVRFLLKIALLLAQVPQTNRLSTVCLKIDTSLWRLNPGSTSKRFGFIEFSPSVLKCAVKTSVLCAGWCREFMLNKSTFTQLCV